MKDRPFLEIFLLFLLVALVVANAWDFMFRPDHSLASLAVSVLIVLVVVVTYLQMSKKKD